MSANPLRYAGGILSKGAFDAFKERINPERYGGAPLLGLNGHVLKAHGSSSRHAIKSAIRAANDMIKADLNHRIEADVLRANQLIAAPAPTPAPLPVV
jgi:glycerol-3-phosphate acyltransferase PlsX